jgi:hypothetical protein
MFCLGEFWHWGDKKKVASKRSFWNFLKMLPYVQGKKG